LQSSNEEEPQTEGSQVEQLNIEDLPVQQIEIAKLKFDKTNPNKPTPAQIAGVRFSLLRYGNLNPIIINENYEIADGEHRALIYQQLGKTHIPGKIVPKTNDDIERRLLRQALNKNHGEHEWKLDAEEINIIFQNKKLDELVNLIGQSKESVQTFLKKHKGIQFPDPDKFPIDQEKELLDSEPKTKLGDLYKLGRHRLICADSVQPTTFTRLIDPTDSGAVVDMVFADPPFELETEFNIKIFENLENFTDLQFWMLADKAAVELGALKMQEFSRFYIHDYLQPFYLTPSQVMKQHTVIAQFGKRKIKNLHDGFTSIIRSNTTHTTGQDHAVFAYSKRPELPKMFISHFFTEFEDPNRIIVDPFGGSGTTMIAAELCNIPAYLAEISPKHCDIIVKRWELFTQQKAELIGHLDQ
jgi:16S rRNA G966 N2-methylase RsmD